MKKTLRFTLIALMGVLLFSACADKKNTKNVSLKTDLDSLSYAIGVQNGDQIVTYLPAQGRLDEDNLDDFVAGFLDAVYSKEVKNKNYDLGSQIGLDMKNSLKEAYLIPDDSSKVINKDAFIDGFVDIVLKKSNLKMTADEAQIFSKMFFEKLEATANAPSIEKEKAFLEENKTKEGIIETETGLQYQVIVQGTGPIPGENMEVKVNYVGTLLDGTKFDSSYDREEPFVFNTSGGVIPAWIEISKIMPVGSKYIVYAPSYLAYGSNDMGTIPPYSTLVFEIEMLEIIK